MTQRKSYQLLLFFVVLVFISSCSNLPSIVEIRGSSMEPSYPDGTNMVFSHMNPNEIHRGDIILYEFPLGSNTQYANRVVGLPGETVEIDIEKIFIDGELLSEPYPTYPANYSGEWIVKDNQFFVLGDNRPDSFDSHLSGPVCFECIEGVLVIAKQK